MQAVGNLNPLEMILKIISKINKINLLLIQINKGLDDTQGPPRARSEAKPERTSTDRGAGKGTLDLLLPARRQSRVTMQE